MAVPDALKAAYRKNAFFVAAESMTKVGRFFNKMEPSSIRRGTATAMQNINGMPP